MIVTDIGWLGELPDEVARKVPVDVTAPELAETCSLLLDDHGDRAALGRTARTYAESHTFEDTARALLEILDQSERSGRSTA